MSWPLLEKSLQYVTMSHLSGDMCGRRIWGWVPGIGGQGRCSTPQGHRVAQSENDPTPQRRP